MSEAASLDDNAQPAHTLLFVYGSLMRGLELHEQLAGALFVARGRISGTLVSLGEYPGLIEGDGDVHGELYRLDSAAMLCAIDDLEEYDAQRPEQSLYLRVERDVRLDDGSTVRACVYLYNRDARDVSIIASGDWRDAVT